MTGAAHGTNQTLSSSMGAADNYTRWIVETFRPFLGRRLMEIGLGCGNYRGLLGPLERYLGVDVDEATVRAQRAARPQETFVVADIAAPDFVDAVAPADFDTVLCVNVLEHVADERAAIGNLLASLVPGGRLLLFVPALPALYTRLDALAGHLRRYVPADLRRLATAGQGEIEKLEYFNAVGAVGWWAQKLVAHDSLEDRSVTTQVALFDRYVLPASRCVNPLFKRFFGQSLVCVIKRAQ